MWEELKPLLEQGDIKALSRIISLVENRKEGWNEFLSSLNLNSGAAIIGITGPPGAGKSTLTDKLVGKFAEQGKKTAVLCVDPSSPFKFGAVLGDRIRMNEWYDHSLVYIRSLATRGSLGGLHPAIMEITDILKAAGFDMIIIETVGVGQSEVEIASLADKTIVVLVPESGDEVQTMKAGLMEIADIFVVNKADRPGADLFLKNIKSLAHSRSSNNMEIPVIKTIASRAEGIDELIVAIADTLSKHDRSQKQLLLAEKAFYLIREQRMADITKEKILSVIQNEGQEINLYKFVQRFLTPSPGKTP